MHGLPSISSTWPIKGLRYPTSTKPNKKHVFVPFKNTRVADAICKALKENLATCDRDTTDVAFAAFIDAAHSVIDQFQHHDIMVWMAMVGEKVSWMQNGPSPAAQLTLLMALATARVAFTVNYYLDHEFGTPAPPACRTAVAIDRLLDYEADETHGQAPQILVSVFARGREPMFSQLSGLRALLAFAPDVRGEVMFGDGALISNTQLLTMAEPGEEGRAGEWLGRLTSEVDSLSIEGSVIPGINHLTSGVGSLGIEGSANQGPREANGGEVVMGEGGIGAQVPLEEEEQEEVEEGSSTDDDEMMED